MAGNLVGRHARSIRRVLRKLSRRRVKPLLATKIVGRSGLRIAIGLTTVSLLLSGVAIIACIMVVTRLYRLRFFRQNKVA